jgi:hypothetical protein
VPHQKAELAERESNLNARFQYRIDQLKISVTAMAETITLSSSPHSLADTECRILLSAAVNYFSFPELGPERNRLCQQIAEQLAPLNPFWTCRQVRSWFNELCDWLDGFHGPAVPTKAVPVVTRSTSPGSPGSSPQTSSEGSPSSLVTLQATSSVSRSAGRPFSAAAVKFPVQIVPAAPGEEGDTEYANALTEPSLSRLMSDSLVATSLINSVLGATVSGFSHVGELEILDPDIIDDPEPTGAVYFHGKTNDRDVMIVFEVEWPYYICSDRFFSNDPPFGAPEFADGRGLRARVRDLPEWRRVLKAVYIVQLVRYEEWIGDDDDDEPGQYFRVRQQLNEVGIGVVHRIEIRLPRINLRFPVEAEIGVGLTPVEWWYFVFKFSDHFNDEELERCRGLGMPEAVISGLCQLDQKFWEEDLRRSYMRDFQAIASLRRSDRQQLLGE